MPCRTDYPGDSEQEVREELDKVTAMLCAVCTRIEKIAEQQRVTPADVSKIVHSNRLLHVWWGKHQAFDRERRATERKAARAKRKRLEAELRKLDALANADEHEDQYRQPVDGDPIYSLEASSTISLLEDGFYTVIGVDFNGEIADLVWSAEHQAWTDERFEECSAEVADDDEEDEDDEEDDDEVVNPEIGDTFLLRRGPNTKGVDREMKVIRVNARQITVVDAHGRNKKVVPRSGLTLDDETECLINPTYEASLRKGRK